MPINQEEFYACMVDEATGKILGVTRFYEGGNPNGPNLKCPSVPTAREIRVRSGPLMDDLKKEARLTDVIEKYKLSGDKAKIEKK